LEIGVSEEDYRPANGRRLTRPIEVDDREKAYILGLVHDLYPTRDSPNVIRFSLSTTHTAMMILVLHTTRFKRVYTYIDPPREDQLCKSFGYKVNLTLDRGYDFALKNDDNWKRYIEGVKWALKNYPYEFLAGIIDADGYIGIQCSRRRKRETVEYRYFIEIGLEKEGWKVINLIYKTLRDLGYDVKKYKSIDNGKVIWKVRLTKKSDIIKFLKLLPVRHGEKVAVKTVILRSKISIEEQYKWYKKFREIVKKKVKRDLEKLEKMYRNGKRRIKHPA